jgi:formylglycine-generating enzyme required for sulfatase activity
MKKYKILYLITVFVLLSAFSQNYKRPNKMPKDFVFIPMGTYILDSNKISVQAFYISKTEVTNKQYREFLSDLKAKRDFDAYKSAMPDTNKWQNDLYGKNLPLVEIYFRHPAYDDYPVVNVSREGAELYCKWLTKKYESLLGNSNTQFRLPMREEWIWAAKGGLSQTLYPWEGKYLRNSKGCYLCNFRTLNEKHITFNYETGQYELISEASKGMADGYDLFTAKVMSYKPNNYGLYDMSGNVAEMVQQKDIVVGGSWMSAGNDVRIESVAPYKGPEPTVGFRPVISFISN